MNLLHVHEYVLYLTSRDYLNCSHKFVREFTIQPSNVHPLSKLEDAPRVAVRIVKHLEKKSENDMESLNYLE